MDTNLFFLLLFVFFKYIQSDRVPKVYIAKHSSFENICHAHRLPCYRI